MMVSDSGYKKNRVFAPKSSDLGASETRFHPNLLLHYFLKFTKKRHTHLSITWLSLPQARLGFTDKIFFLVVYYNKKEWKSKIILLGILQNKLNIDTQNNDLFPFLPLLEQKEKPLLLRIAV